MYNVIARHTKSRFESPTDTVLATHSERKAVETARDVEKLGYKFTGLNDQVTVIRISEEHPYHAENDPVATQTTVFTRSKQGGEWVEEWPNSKFKKAFEGKKEAVTAEP